MTGMSRTGVDRPADSGGRCVTGSLRIPVGVTPDDLRRTIVDERRGRVYR